MSYHLFLSYSRRDNVPRLPTGEGWVTAFKAALEARHRARSGRELRIFFDKDSIGEGRDWRREIGIGLRQSRLFLAFLSPHYVTSENCLWEWEEYLRREHSVARGDDGIMPVFFVAPDDLRIADREDIADWLREMERKYPWFKAEAVDARRAERLARPFAADLSRRNQRTPLELHPWFDEGPAILRTLDAAERSEDVKRTGRGQAGDPRTLADRLAELDRHVARRIDRLALADLAPGNMPRSHEHFVGRHRELTALHDVMMSGGPRTGGQGAGGCGIIAATFAPGGLGKTALARQYAHAYAEFFAAGGTWEIGCEGLTTIGAALARLAESADFQRACETGFDVAAQRPLRLTEPLTLSERARRDDRIAGEEVLDYLRRLTSSRQARMLDEFAWRVAEGAAERHTPAADAPELATPRALLVLDNVDRPELLSAEQLALLPTGDWLGLIVTTRLDPARFGGGERIFSPVEVGMLPEDDALRLLADFQPGARFGSAADEDAARGIARALGGYTLAVELVAAYLGTRAPDGYGPADHLRLIESKGLLAPVDALAGEGDVAGKIRHRANVAENQIASLVGWSLARLSPRARTAIEFASLLMPDRIPLHWLETLTTEHHENLRSSWCSPSRWWAVLRERLGSTARIRPAKPESDSQKSPPSRAVYRELRGLRLLAPAGAVETDDRGVEAVPSHVRIHRLVAAHVAARGLPRHTQAIECFVDVASDSVEEHVHKGELLPVDPDLFSLCEHLVNGRDQSRRLLRAARTFARHEGHSGSFPRGLGLSLQILATREKRFSRHPCSEERARDVCLSLHDCSEFLLEREQPGDRERADEWLTRSLTLFEKIAADRPDDDCAQRDVFVSLHKLAAARAGDLDRSITYCERARDIAESLATRAPADLVAQANVVRILLLLARRLHERDAPGDVDRALASAERCVRVSEALMAAQPTSTLAADTFSESLEIQGDCLLRLGRPEGEKTAISRVIQRLGALERQAERYPDNRQSLEQLADALTDAAGMLASSSDPADTIVAVAYFERSRHMYEGLLDKDMSSPARIRLVSESAKRLVQRLLGRCRQEDEDRLFAHYDHSLEIDERLLERSFKLSYAAEVIGNVSECVRFLVDRRLPGDAERALACFERALGFRERATRTLVNKETRGRFDRSDDRPFEARRKDDAEQAVDRFRDVLLLGNVDVVLGMALERLVSLLVERGDGEDAERAIDSFRRCVDIDSDPTRAHPYVARSVSMCLGTLADFLVGRGQPGDGDKALVAFERALEIDERLLEASPDSAKAARSVSLSLGKVADALTKRGQPGDQARAIAAFERSLEIDDRLHQANPDSAEAVADLTWTLERLARIKHDAGIASQALDYQDRAVGLRVQATKADPASAGQCTTAAESAMQAARYASDAGRSQQAADYRRLAYEVLKQAIAAGTSIDADLISLHEELTAEFGDA